MPNILVTGGAGNIASALVKALVAKPDNHVVVVDNLLTGSLSKLPPAQSNMSFVKCDVNDFNDISGIFYAHRFKYVFHFAAVVGVERTLAHPLLVLEDIKGIENVLRLSKNMGVERVYYSSSSEVYGESVELPQHEETTPLNSRLPYAVVKNLGEAYCRSYEQEFGLPYTIFRFFNTYGPHQSEDFVIPRFVCKALRNEDIPIYGDGQQTRTFIYISDNIDVCTRIHESGKFLNDVVNVGGEDEITILDLAKTVVRVTGSSSKLKFLAPLGEGDMKRRKPDLTKMKQVRETRVSLEQGIKNLVDFYSHANRK